jgi:hypothetical protein
MFLLAANTGFPVIESDPECNPTNNSRNWDTRTRGRVKMNYYAPGRVKDILSGIG